MGARISRRRPEKHGIILMVGLDGAGKTTIANMLQRQLTFQDLFETEPTEGWHLSMYAFRVKEYIFSICEVGGHKNYRYMWRNFKQNDLLVSWAAICGVIFVVDSSDLERMEEVKELYSALVQRLAEDRSRPVDWLPVPPVLVISNKQDLPGALRQAEVSDQLSLEKYKSYCWQVNAEFSVVDGVEGLEKAVRILYKLIKKREKVLKQFWHMFEKL